MSAVISPLEPVFRPMKQGDLEDVLLTENAAYPFPWTRGIFLDCLRVGYYCVVVEVDGQMVGHGVMSVAVGECHLLNLCVHPDYQGQGIGTSLIHYLLEVAHWKHARIAFLEVRLSNEKAFRLYTHLGFQEIGLRRNYYPAHGDQREDARILTMDLPPGSVGA